MTWRQVVIGNCKGCSITRAIQSCDCVVPENINTLPTEGNGNSERKGALKGDIFLGGSGRLFEVLFCGGLGIYRNVVVIPSVGGYGYFPELHISENDLRTLPSMAQSPYYCMPDITLSAKVS